MQTYIALLRGINVSGQKIIKMAELRTHLEKAGLKEVQTYIQSGNIVFKHTDSPEKLTKTIVDTIQSKYGFEVPTLVITADYIKEVLDNDPYTKNPDINPDKVYFTLLADAPKQEHVEKLKEYNYPPEEWVLGNKVIYFHSPNGAGNAKFSNNFFEQKLKVQATTRNLKTMNKLLEMGQ